MGEQPKFLHKEAAIHELQNRGYKLVIFDFDETLATGHPIFVTRMDFFAKTVAEEAGMTEDERVKFTEYFHDFNKQTLAIDGISVSEEKWRWAIEFIGKMHPQLLTPMQANIDILEGIYFDSPEKIDGVEQILADLEKAGFKLAVLTHASPEWTRRKMEKTGLLTYFEPKLIYTASVYGSKTSHHWSEAIRGSRESPSSSIAVGNNLYSDIMQAHLAEIPLKVWLRDPGKDEYFAQGVVPPGTATISHYGDFYSAILEKLGGGGGTRTRDGFPRTLSKRVP